MECTNAIGLQLSVTFVYKHGKSEERKELWSDMKLIAPLTQRKLWTVLRDFNEILQESERTRLSTYANEGSVDFRDMVVVTKLNYIPRVDNTHGAIVE